MSEQDAQAEPMPDEAAYMFAAGLIAEFEAQRELVRVGVEEIERLRADNQRLSDENEELRGRLEAEGCVP